MSDIISQITKGLETNRQISETCLEEKMKLNCNINIHHFIPFIIIRGWCTSNNDLSDLKEGGASSNSFKTHNLTTAATVTGYVCGGVRAEKVNAVRCTSLFQVV